ncbi:endonuclease domain-containing protein [Actinoplanes sp. CA-015351]|uniref:endonuclease domain-containing protein n=1 Tax=Actinoplanes sp. CA-015351 TaxID=3239897 RepID=UPI003D98C6BB
MNAAQLLAGVPVDRVVALPGIPADDLALLIAGTHPDLAVVVSRPAGTPAAPRDVVRAAVSELERVAVELLPAWLPDAAAVDRPDVLGLAAIRLAAADLARRTRYPVPFLIDLAILALTARHTTVSTLPLHTRTAALARIVAEAFGRRQVVLLLESAGDREIVAAGAQWLVGNGGPAVWIVGPEAEDADRIPVHRLTRPLPASPESALPGPGVVGKPHPASSVERALEAALAAKSWAAGRMWNQTYQSHALTTPIRLDLLWPGERCVVELDGPEHCHPRRFEEDRQRDVQLQLDGYAVLRFTNARVIHDVGAVVHQIGAYLKGRRSVAAEGNPHGRR